MVFIAGQCNNARGRTGKDRWEGWVCYLLTCGTRCSRIFEEVEIS